jgi:CHASE1-domain containing sensor protein
VSLPKFQSFARRLIEHDASILSTSLIARVTRDGRAARSGWTTSSDTRLPDPSRRPTLGKEPSPSPQRDEYFPLLFSTDDPTSTAAYGLDLGSEEGRLRTVEQARDSGEIAVSPIVVLHAGKGNHRGFFALLPVYRPRSSARFHRGPPPQSGWICPGRVSEIHDD